jgi:hypothetical protein
MATILNVIDYVNSWREKNSINEGIGTAEWQDNGEGGYNSDTVKGAEARRGHSATPFQRCVPILPQRGCCICGDRQGAGFCA